jgi:hypothetical protein
MWYGGGSEKLCALVRENAYKNGNDMQIAQNILIFW